MSRLNTLVKMLNALDAACEVVLHYTVCCSVPCSWILPFDGRVLILCKSPVCVWLLQLHEKRGKHIDSNLTLFIKKNKNVTVSNVSLQNRRASVHLRANDVCPFTFLASAEVSDNGHELQSIFVFLLKWA